MSADVVDVALGGVGREADGPAGQTSRRPDPIADHPQEGVDGIGNVDANSTRTSKPICNRGASASGEVCPGPVPGLN